MMVKAKGAHRRRWCQFRRAGSRNGDGWFIDGMLSTLMGTTLDWLLFSEREFVCIFDGICRALSK
jgi:hypothetical protein